MKSKIINLVMIMTAIGFIFGIVITPAGSVFAEKKKPNVLPPHAYPFGMSYGDWSAEWWMWQLRLPATDHPAFSLDGANCADGQYGKVWFLTGAFTTEVPQNEFNTIVRESCAVPTGKAIFFPIINIECSTVEDFPFQLILEGTDSNVDSCASKFVDGPFAVVEDISIEVDGDTLENPENYRVQSPVYEFYFDEPNDNILGVDCDSGNCVDMEGVSDGYWIMLPPLSRGEHTVQFTGSFRDSDTGDLIFGLDVTYILTVEGGKR